MLVLFSLSYVGVDLQTSFRFGSTLCMFLFIIICMEVQTVRSQTLCDKINLLPREACSQKPERAKPTNSRESTGQEEAGSGHSRYLLGGVTQSWPPAAV